MSPNAIWHAIDAATLSAGRARRRKRQSWALTVTLLLCALAGACSL